MRMIPLASGLFGARLDTAVTRQVATRIARLNLATVGLPPLRLEGPNCLYVGGLPYFWGEAKVRQFLESFGALSGFDYMKDKNTGNSKGYAFFVYQDSSAADIARSSLNGAIFGDIAITVRRASYQSEVQANTKQKSGTQQHITWQVRSSNLLLLPYVHTHLLFLLIPNTTAFAETIVAINPPPTRVLLLTEAVTKDELIDNEDYRDIIEDKNIECRKYGKMVIVFCLLKKQTLN
ncbi:putative RNA recognition motif domain, nucleotide-binding alpha-beta plait domain superfamily [Helianthus debilis subsp. tardiflorus]